MSGNQIKIKRKKKKNDKLGFNWFLWISLVLIAIPCCFFVSLLLQAKGEAKTPIIGSRIDNSVVNRILDADVEKVRNDLSSNVNIDKYEVNLIVETLRITVDARDEMDCDQIKELAKEIYGIVDRNIPIATYFTKIDETKQYDLEINIYDDYGKETPCIVTLVKNGNMEEYMIQVLSDPKNQELVNELTGNE